METAVYLFTGFLEAGKTKFITETMSDENFNDGKRKYLIITCEEGEEEYYPEEEYTEDSEYEEDYIPEDEYYPEDDYVSEDEYYEEEIETAISYY